MDFCKISLCKTPELLFAHTYQSSYSTWPYLQNPQLVEITYLEHGKLLFHTKNAPSVSYEAPCIIVPHSRYSRVEVVSPFHRHHTFSFFAGTPTELLTEDQIDHHTLLAGQPNSQFSCILPTYIPGGSSCEKIARNISLIIVKHDGVLLSEKLEIYKCLFDIFAEAARYTADRLSAVSDSTYISLHTTRAIQYINTHLEHVIRVQDVADALHISYGYLSRVFRKDMGIPLISYINEVKIKRIKELILAKGFTLEEAGAVVGIYNTKYLSRIFKLYSGMTAKDYKKAAGVNITKNIPEKL